MTFSRQVYRAAHREIDRPWHEANIKAKLGERQKQCAQARSIAAKAYVAHKQGHPITAHLDLIGAINEALTKFWLTQKSNRIVRRILRELDAAQRSVLRRAG